MNLHSPTSTFFQQLGQLKQKGVCMLKPTHQKGNQKVTTIYNSAPYSSLKTLFYTPKKTQNCPPNIVEWKESVYFSSTKSFNLRMCIMINRLVEYPVIASVSQRFSIVCMRKVHKKVCKRIILDNYSAPMETLYWRKLQVG